MSSQERHHVGEPDFLHIKEAMTTRANSVAACLSYTITLPHSYNSSFRGIIVSRHARPPRANISPPFSTCRGSRQEVFASMIMMLPTFFLPGDLFSNAKRKRETIVVSERLWLFVSWSCHALAYSHCNTVKLSAGQSIWKTGAENPWR